MTNIWFKAKIRHTANFEKLFSRLPSGKLSVGAEGQDYKLVFTGTTEDGLPILNEILAEGHCSIQITCGY